MKQYYTHFYEISSKEIYSYILKASEDFKSKEKRRVPEWIKHGSRGIKISFIRGFFDADGSYTINYDKYDYQVRFGQVDKQVILDVKEILEKLGFKVSNLLGPYKYKENAKSYYEIQIHGKYQFLRFNRIIKPIHPNKQMDGLSKS